MKHLSHMNFVLSSTNKPVKHCCQIQLLQYVWNLFYNSACEFPFNWIKAALIIETHGDLTCAITLHTDAETHFLQNYERIVLFDYSRIFMSDQVTFVSNLEEKIPLRSFTRPKLYFVR